MSELRKANTDHPYFVTMTIAGWVDLFTRERYCEIMIDSLKYCIKEKGLRVFEYVIMPSHLHMIIRHDESKLPDVIRDLKSYTAKRILEAIWEPGESRRDWLLALFRDFATKTRQNKEYMIWNKTNHPIELSAKRVYDQKATYIIMNPVQAGLTADETSWKYSSACTQSPLQLTESGEISI